jgi:predicted lipid carrier protein YhbT|nr:SCP2 sterol-binding domain-containing protein [Pantoea ananatis]
MALYGNIAKIFVTGVQNVFQRLSASLVKNGPKILSLPATLAPFMLKKQLLQQLLNWQFRHVLAEGELDFLQGRFLGIEISDINLTWITTLEGGQLRVLQHAEADVWFRGNANDLLLVAARKADPDMLFFQRRLLIEGDTELGLEVKNVMDAIELNTMPKGLRTAIQQMAAIVETTMQQDAKAAQARAGVSC